MEEVDSGRGEGGVGAVVGRREGKAEGDGGRTEEGEGEDGTGM